MMFKEKDHHLQTCQDFHVEQATRCTSKCSFLQCELQVQFLYGTAMHKNQSIRLTAYTHQTFNPVSILHKSIAGRYRPVRIADGPITARCRFMQNASWEVAQNLSLFQILYTFLSELRQEEKYLG